MIDSSDIHPMRFARTRPFARECIAVLRRTSVGRQASLETLQQFMGGMMEHYNRAILRVPVEHRPRHPTPLLSQEASLALHFAMFSEAGRNIFALGPNLTEMLGHTDLGGVRAGDVRFPYPVFHVAFDRSFDACLPGPENRIDGVYVRGLPGGKTEFVVTSRRLDSTATRSSGWPFTRDVFFYASLDFSDRSKDLGALVEEAVATGEIKVVADLLAPSSAVEEAGEELGVVVRDVSQRTRDEVAAFNREGLPSFRRALGLAVGALCYLNSRDPDEPLPSRFPDDAPSDAVTTSLDEGRSKNARRQAYGSLLEGGYMVTRLLEVRSPRSDLAASGESGREMPVHWRRGHFRRQAHGPREAPQHRLTWIYPVLVNANALDPADGTSEVPGRVYRM